MKPAPARPTSPKSAGTWPGTDLCTRRGFVTRTRFRFAGKRRRLPAASAACMMDRPTGAAMNSVATMSAPELDEHFLRRSFDVARRSMTHGNHPFGAILVDRDRNVLIEAENGYMPSRDGTAHAERLLATQACTTLGPDVLAGATLYSSAEPCAMCEGAIYWAGIGRLVYGLSEHRLRGMTGNHPENPTLDLACREVFRSGQRVTEVLGPLLEDEAEACLLYTSPSPRD